MTAHEKLREDIPAYVASRLSGSELRELEVHLGSCDQCAEIVARFREIASALREQGDAILAPHPDGLALQAHAIGDPAAADPAIVRHLRLCISCQFEVSAAQRRGMEGESRSRSARPPRRRAVAMLAAGLVLGVALTALSRLLIPSSPTPGEAGPAQLMFLRPVRGGEIVQGRRIGPRETLVILAVQAPIPETAHDDERFRFEIRRDDGPVVWTTEASASTIRGIMETSEVVTLPVPTEQLPPGRYELGLAAVGEQPILQIPFEITDSR